MGITKISELCPTDFLETVRNFSDGEYLKRQNQDELPNIKNRYEAYGILAENFVAVKTAAKQVEKALGDALAALATNDADTAFYDAAEMAFDGCIGVAYAASNMSVHARNIVYQLSAYAGADIGRTPLEGLIEDACTEELPETADE